MASYMICLFALALGLPAASTDIDANFFSANCALGASRVPSCRITSGQDANAQAVGFFRDDIETTGWGRLFVKTASSEAGLDAFAGGYLEGYLTAHRVLQHLENSLKGEGLDHLSKGVSNFLNTMDTWWGQATARAETHDEYWGAVSFIRNQLSGLIDGVNARLPRGQRKVTRLDMLMLNSLFDMGDIKQAVNVSERADFKRMSNEALTDWDRQHGHCSALIKLLPDYSDLFAGHNTWQGFHLMLRIFKRYEFGFRTPIAMSSYPGIISSADDFYQIGNLVVTETTLPNYNNELFSLIKAESLPFWIRAMTANQLATSGPDWMSIFQKHNSGTYNNAWMVVDYSKFSPGEPLREGLLTVGEQLPGYFHYEDQTMTLAYGYWPSYNVALYPETARLIKQGHMEKTKGNHFSYEMAERAQIFRRDQGSIASDIDMQRVMRYNKFQTDPVAHGDPCSQLACRRDLDPQPATRKAFGATDAKYTSAKHVQEGRTIIAVGPTHDDQPPFDWRAAPEFESTVPHIGQPDRFDFGWIVIGADLEASPWSNSRSSVITSALPLLSVVSIMAVGLVLAAALVRLRANRKGREPISSPDDGYKHLVSSPALSNQSTACPWSPAEPHWLLSSPAKKI